MKYYGRISIPVVSIIVIAAWHMSYFLIDNAASHTFLIVDGFIKYDFIYTPLILPFFWWMGKKYDEARFYSDHDPLTGLYNRRFVWGEIPSLLKSCNKTGAKLYIYVVDINCFKKINDNQGHEVGDRVIQDVSVALLKSTSESSVVARWGGDEFLVITSEYKDESPYSLLEMIEQSIHNSSLDNITVSIGHAVYPSDAKLPNELIRIADERMYENKLGIFTIDEGHYHKDSPISIIPL